MAIENIATNKLAWTIVGVFGASLPIFGYQVVIFAFLSLCVIQLLDFLTWFIAARKQKAITSKIWINWMIKKSLIIILCMVLLFGVSWLKGTGAIENNVIGYVPLWAICIFIFFDIISIFENLTVIFWDSREWKFFKLLSSLTNMIFNLSLDKLKEVSEKKIQDKLNSNK